MLSSENKVNGDILCKEVKNKITDERAQLHGDMYVHLPELDKYGKKNDCGSCFNCTPSLDLFLFTLLTFDN